MHQIGGGASAFASTCCATERSFLELPSLPLGSPARLSTVGYRTLQDRNTKGSATLGIAALGIAMVYLLAVAAGFIGALLALVWLFGEAPDEGTRTVERTRNTDRFGTASVPPASVGSEHSEDEAA